MIKLGLFAFLLLVEISSAVAQKFNPGLAEKSLVKIMVPVPGTKKMGVCSGFIWKKNSWVVTSLHAMQAGGKAKVVYPGEEIRDATVIKVFQQGDLVLLETTFDSKPVQGVSPLTNYNKGELTFGDKIYAIGYNSGSLGDQTQALEKGHANPETLEFLIREEDKTQIRSLKFPSLELPIYFLSGSLLPGFSGSPVFNASGDLIGIGDGGLERGLMNVSWCIPAMHLNDLEASTVSTLPANIGTASQLYSAEVSINVSSEDAEQNLKEAVQQADTAFSTFAYGDFQFYQTKTRSFKEMESTAIDPENMASFDKDFKSSKIDVDYSDLNFDIYEEINNGFVIAVPEGCDLHYDKELNEFSVDLDGTENENSGILEGKYFELYYDFMQHKGDPVAEVVKEANDIWGKNTNGLTIDPHYSKSIQLNDEWKEEYISVDGNEGYEAEKLGKVAVTIYLNIIYNDKVAFYSTAVSYVPSGEDIINAFTNGLDCVNNYKGCTHCCDYFGSLMQVIAAAHMATLSSRY